MNIRLDSCSLRVRLSWEEANDLLSGEDVREFFPIINREFICQIKDQLESFVSLNQSVQENIYVYILKKELEKLLKLMLENRKLKKDQCALKSIFPWDERLVEVRFEIDYLSKKIEEVKPIKVEPLEEGCCGICVTP